MPINQWRICNIFLENAVFRQSPDENVGLFMFGVMYLGLLEKIQNK